MAKTRNFAEAIKRKLAADADLAAQVEKESFNAHVAQEIYLARRCAKLTQQQLADMLGTQQSVVARLEDADYDGHSLSLLSRIAEALNKRLHVEFYAPRDFRPVYQAVLPVTTPQWNSAPAWQPKVSVKRRRTRIAR